MSFDNGEWDPTPAAAAKPVVQPKGWWDRFDFEGVLRGTSFKIKEVRGNRPALVWRDDESHISFVSEEAPADFSEWADSRIEEIE